MNKLLVKIRVRCTEAFNLNSVRKCWPQDYVQKAWRLEEAWHRLLSTNREKGVL